MNVLLRMIEILFEFSDILNEELLEYFLSPDDIMNLQIRVIHDDIFIKIEPSGDKIIFLKIRDIGDVRDD